MMKKLIAFAIALCFLFLNLTSLAEEFTLRNGIHFGMTISEVEKLETMPRDKKYNSTVYHYGYGEIAGIKNSGVEYNFENGKLKGVEIHFDDLNKKSTFSVSQDYSDISALLEAKYGAPIGNKKGNSSVLRGTEFSSVMRLYSIWPSVSYEEWLIEVDGGCVKIDHFIFGDKTKCTHLLEYTFFSESEVLSLMDNL